MRILLFLLLISITPLCKAQQSDYHQRVAPRFNGDMAYSTVAYVEQFWRLAGNPGFDSSIQYVKRHLEQAGYKEESRAEAGSRLTYRIEHRPLDHPAWQPISGLVLINGDTLLTTRSNRNMLTINSWSTDPQGLDADILWIPEPSALDSLDIRGKILFGQFNPYAVFKKAMAGGAAGILSYSNPDYLQPEKNSTSIQFRGIPYDTVHHPWTIALSYEAWKKLKNECAAGPVKAHVVIETEWVDSDELTLIAQVRGSRSPEEELVISAHVQEPGANDNASGVGVATEMAALTASLLNEGTLDPDRTLTFLWGDEIISTGRYVEDHGKHIKWGMSLDMVGEDTGKTGGTFLIEKMPDPSAIWTRGEDRHTEWGAGKVNLEDLRPHYLNGFVINRFRAQGQQADWKVSVNPFEGGSDHVPFLEANIPGVLFWHFTDQFYHTDNDRLDKVSRETMKNVGIATLTCAYTLLNGHEALARQLLGEISADAKERLTTENALSRQAIMEDPSAKATQDEILKTWKDWYLGAAESVTDLVKDDRKLKKSIDRTKEEILGY